VEVGDKGEGERQCDDTRDRDETNRSGREGPCTVRVNTRRHIDDTATGNNKEQQGTTRNNREQYVQQGTVRTAGNSTYNREQYVQQGTVRTTGNSTYNREQYVQQGTVGYSRVLAALTFVLEGCWVGQDEGQGDDRLAHALGGRVEGVERRGKER
jgi:hypothetical protein